MTKKCLHQLSVLAQVTLVHGFDEVSAWDHMRLMNMHWWSSYWSTKSRIHLKIMELVICIVFIDYMT